MAAFRRTKRSGVVEGIHCRLRMLRNGTAFFSRDIKIHKDRAFSDLL